MSTFEEESDPARLSVRVERLLRLPWLAGLKRQAVIDLAAVSVLRQYPTQTIILAAGSTDPSVMIIVSGAIRLYGLSSKGREVTLEEARAPTIFGLTFVHPEVPQSYFVSTLKSDTTILHVGYDDYFDWLAQHPEAAIGALKLVSSRLSTARDRLADFALYDVKTRLAHSLAKLALRNGPVLHLKHEELASLIGARQEEVTRTLRSFREQGLIDYKPHQRGFRVKNITQLSRFGLEPRES